jgi:hypothetical protein
VPSGFFGHLLFFYPFIIYGYFDILKKVLDDNNIEPRNIWNLDETSISIDPTKSKVVGARGVRATRTTSTSDRENTTVLVMASATREKAPPLTVFKGAHIWDQWIAPKNTEYPGTVYAASKNG